MPFSIKNILPSVIIFLAVSAIVFFLRPVFKSSSIVPSVVMAFNALFFVLNLLTHFLQAMSLKNSSPHAFLRSVMMSLMLKMFATVIAVFVYKMLAGDAFSAKTVFVSLFLYLIYLGVEVAAFNKINKKKA